MDNKTPQQRRTERQKYMRVQRIIRTAVILLALVLSIVSLSQSCATRKAIDELAEQLRAKKIAEAQEAILAASESSEEEEEEAEDTPVDGVSVTLSFVGDCVLATDENDSYDGSLNQYYDDYGASYFFQNVKSIFEGDDLTVASLDSTLSLSGSRQDQEEAFRADPSYVDILTAGDIDAVSVANEHTHDYGDESYVDTLAYLDIAEIGRFGFENVLTMPLTGTASGTLAASAADSSSAIEETNGVLVGLTGVWQGDSDDYARQALENIEELQEDGAEIIIVSIHWASEDETQPDDSQIELAHDLIDAGADLIVGHQSGTLQGVECYDGKYILYSLGSFLCGGDIDNLDTVIFQQTFTISGGVCLADAAYTLIPCSASSSASVNDYCPTPAAGDEAQRILDELYERSDLLDGGIRQDSAE